MYLVCIRRIGNGSARRPTYAVLNMFYAATACKEIVEYNIEFAGCSTMGLRFMKTRRSATNATVRTARYGGGGNCWLSTITIATNETQMTCAGSSESVASGCALFGLFAPSICSHLRNPVLFAHCGHKRRGTPFDKPMILVVANDCAAKALPRIYYEN